MRTERFDAVVIGSGCAGYNCADWLFDLGYKNIALLTEGRLLGTSRNTGSDKQTYYKLSLAGDEGDSVMNMAQTLFSGGAMDGDVALAEAANSARCFLKLAGLGVRFPTNEYGEFVGYKTDHDPFCRATSIGPYTSKAMTEVLEAVVEEKGIRILDDTQAVKILTEGGRAVGVLALDTSKPGKPGYVAISAPHVILATGGPAAVYFDSVYPVSQTGNSSLALEAGAAFGNLSEWQYGLASTDFRWNVSGTYQQVLPRYISIDAEGNEHEFLCDYFENPSEAIDRVFLKGYEWPFDVRKLHGSSYIDLLVYRESVVLGRKVYMDFTREPTGIGENFSGVGEVAKKYLSNSDALIARPIERLNKMNPGAISLYAEHGIDLWKEPLRIAVCAQHNNGGVRIDANWQTTVPGLYVIGEAAGSLGIFRPGGTALNSCQVGGLRAAQHIVYDSKAKASGNFDAIAKKAIGEIDALIEATKGERSTVDVMRARYASRMSGNFAFLRCIPAMKAALPEIEKDLCAFAEMNKWTNADEIPGLFKNLDIIRMSQAIATAILYTAERFGSRGSGFVLDGGNFMDRIPRPEDESGRGQIVTVRKCGDDLKIEVVPVRPIPAGRDLWFEKVWGAYRKRTEGK
ncbi:MAG: FAD-binding protein [Clostridia bacterium]|nr:FAD-binding protein [Clostridia bacterium]